MCFKNWFHKPDPAVYSNKTALLFGINNYPGSVNDLEGCLNDVDDVADKLTNEFPEFKIKKFKDWEVTTSQFNNEIKNVLTMMLQRDVLYIHYSGHGTQIPDNDEVDYYSEALYLFDGPYDDCNVYKLQQLTPDGAKVVIKFDSCFSGGMSRKRNIVKNRFYQMEGVPIRHKVKRSLSRGDNQKWVIFAGCGEDQTSADAWFNNRANGAFTFYDNKSFNPTMTYEEEIFKLKTYLPGTKFDQVPELIGNTILFNNLIFT